MAGLPAYMLADHASVAEEVVLEPRRPTRGRAPASPTLDVSYDLQPGQAAVLAIRHPSGALTFHAPVQATSRGPQSAPQVRFQVALRQPATRGPVSAVFKAIVIKVGKLAVDQAVSLVAPKAVEAFERAIWSKRGLKEGWFKVTRDMLAAGRLEPGRPVSPSRSLLFIHGTFSNAAAAYKDLAASPFFDRVKELYQDRLFAFDHFTLSRTPRDNARMLLSGLPEQTTTFDVITHSRGGLVLRELVERSSQFGKLADRFKLGRAVLVAAPNDGTPLATPRRWEDTVGWLANLLELFPDNPFTTGAEFVANGLVWLASHAAVDLPGLAAMDGDGRPIASLQSPPGPPEGTHYSALVANFQPDQSMVQRLLDAGIDQFFASANDLVVPSEAGWRIGRARTPFIPASRIGCYGPGGNLRGEGVTHIGFFLLPATADFLVNALSGRPQPLTGVDPRKSLPDRRLLRGAVPEVEGVARAARPRAAGRAAAAGRTPQDEALNISVVNGDLRFVAEPLFVGHYHSTQLTGTERVLNELTGCAMEHSLGLGLYPLDVGSHQIFINTETDYTRGVMPRPEAVVVVGLGEEGQLKSADLVRTVRQAVLGWAQRLAEKGSRAAPFEIAATLIGSGGSGIGAGESARLIAQGVTQANRLLKGTLQGQGRWPWVKHLRFVELFLDRASEAWRALRLQASATPGRYEVEEAVRTGTGFLTRPADSGYRGADYDFISVETAKGDKDEPLLLYKLDTKRARSELRGQRTQSLLLRELVATASSDRNDDQRIGRTLFNLLIPPELEAYMVGSGEMQMELDTQTAGIPWELLHTTRDGDTDGRPWSIRVKLIRKLRIPDFRERVVDASVDASALIIGEPCTSGYPRLEGARLEALAVRACLTRPDALDAGLVRALVSDASSQPGADARTVINTLFERPWRIVHIAGHGAAADDTTRGGVVLSNGAFLGPAEIGSLRVVPELVFINCCHLAAGDPDQLLKPATSPLLDRATFASGMARELIALGVRCVIAAGWAVDDDAASVFAETFYAALLDHNRFIDAVATAREAARTRNPLSNTWAAYQCYGDANWVFRRSSATASRTIAAGRPDFSHIGSMASLRLALERNIVRTRFQGAPPAAQLVELNELEKAFGDKWGRNGSIAEQFGEALVEAGAVERGMGWYERAVGAPDGRASVKAAEQLANVRGRLAWERVDAAARHLDAMRARLAGRKSTAKSRLAARRAAADAEKQLRRATADGRALIRSSLELLDRLLAIEPTMERRSLVGSAYKRLALVDGVSSPRTHVDRILRKMRSAYQLALKTGRDRGLPDLFYPAANCLVADVALNGGRAGWRGFDRKTREIVRQSLEGTSRSNADFWSLVGAIELEQWDALARRSLGRAHEGLEKKYRDLHKRVNGSRWWTSVYDTACLVLLNYAARSPKRERDAATALVTLLRGFAHGAKDD